MKQLIFLIVTLGLLTIIGCGDDANTPAGGPTVFLSPNFGNADVGGEILIPVELSAPAGIQSLIITKIMDDIRDESSDVIESAISGQKETTFNYTFSETTKSLVGSTIDLEFILLDDRNKTDTAFFRVGIHAPEILINFGLILRPPQSDLGSSTSETFYSNSSDQMSWSVEQVNSSLEDVSDEIDFGYYFDSTTNSGMLASIEDYPIPNLGGMDLWTSRNATKFRRTTLSGTAFDEALFVEIYRAFSDGTAGERDQRIVGLSVGDVFAFETDPDKEEGSKKGLGHVLDLQPGEGSGEFIQIAFRFEK